MDVNVNECPEKAKPVEQCRHYWVIEPANGPYSRGKCKFCGDTRDFVNSESQLNWGKAN